MPGLRPEPTRSQSSTLGGRWVAGLRPEETLAQSQEPVEVGFPKKNTAWANPKRRRFYVGSFSSFLEVTIRESPRDSSNPTATSAFSNIFLCSA